MRCYLRDHLRVIPDTPPCFNMRDVNAVIGNDEASKQIQERENRMGCLDS